MRLSLDVIVIGAGAVGASAARHLAQRAVRVAVLEKQAGPAEHQSGRNSGVIHPGYNLKPGSLKAKYCVEGNRALREFCRERGVPVVEGGILVVARTEAERATLAERASTRVATSSPAGGGTHVLNAVSPGLTCSLPFGAYLAQLCIQKNRL